MELWDQIKQRFFEPFNYNITVNQYRASEKVKVEKGCNTIQVTNLGTSVITVNGITLFPSATPATVAGDAVVIGGNLGETYKGELNVTVVVPTGAAPLYEVLQKFYTSFEV